MLELASRRVLNEPERPLFASWVYLGPCLRIGPVVDLGCLSTPPFTSLSLSSQQAHALLATLTVAAGGSPLFAAFARSFVGALCLCLVLLFPATLHRRLARLASALLSLGQSFAVSYSALSGSLSLSPGSSVEI
ncbi:hypothetical protein PIB30_049947 [Stylosanthes scabra]|uniref:Uncharacterized protein n=1 Tax=Stylosanthes scabra TaxID=79078 RepID=A0ABU6THW4_9FABA|nr:hypothetical protein [Stylosanthes scabra]